MNGRIHHPPRVSIVYESMFGNTRRIAEAIGEGLRETVPVEVAAVHRLEPWPLAPAIAIVGAPTPVHGLSRPSTRSEAARRAEDAARGLELDTSARGIGMREWLDDARLEVELFAAFDTRADMPEIFTGSAAASIDRRLRSEGIARLADPHSFLVDRENRLEEGEVERARAWGRELGAALAPYRGESEV